MFMCSVGMCMPLSVHGGERMMSGVIVFQTEPLVHCPRLADLKPPTVPFSASTSISSKLLGL